jgi:hypothetical protein
MGITWSVGPIIHRTDFAKYLEQAQTATTAYIYSYTQNSRRSPPPRLLSNVIPFDTHALSSGHKERGNVISTFLLTVLQVLSLHGRASKSQL